MRKTRGEPEAETPPQPAPEPAGGESAEAEESRAGRAETAGEEAPAASETPVDFRDRWLRSEAELQNYRRRAQRDLEEGVRFAEERGLHEVIEMLDDLERALAAATREGAPEAWVSGVRLVANRMRDHLARHGVQPIDALGKPFDPEFHEAMLEVDAGPDQAPGSVAQVVRGGYLRHQRVLRPARVVVARRGE